MFSSGLIFAMTAKITYQGRLREYGTPVNGTRTMNFRIWDAATSGNLKWNYDNVTVNVSSGIFTVQLTPTVDWRNGPYYLETTVTGKTLSPREEITAQMYSLHSSEAENINSNSTINFIVGSN